jgi:hypothetical protein
VTPRDREGGSTEGARRASPLAGLRVDEDLVAGFEAGVTVARPS